MRSLVREYLKIPDDAPCEVYAEEVTKALRDEKHKDKLKKILELDDTWFFLQIRINKIKAHFVDKLHNLLFQFIKHATPVEIEEVNRKLERISQLSDKQLLDNRVYGEIIDYLMKYVKFADENPRRLEVLAEYFKQSIRDLDLRIKAEEIAKKSVRR